MRFLVLLAVFGLAFSSWAQEEKRPKPANLQPLPEAPPPPAVPGGDPDLEPQITITTKDGAKVEEYRVRGKLYAMKVTPAKGAPYYLIDDRGDGQFIRHDSLDSGLRVPNWVLFRF
jgi:hypothetical protein